MEHIFYLKWWQTIQRERWREDREAGVQVNISGIREELSLQILQTLNDSKGYYEQLCVPKFDKLSEIDQFLQGHKLPKLT